MSNSRFSATSTPSYPASSPSSPGPTPSVPSYLLRWVVTSRGGTENQDLVSLARNLRRMKRKLLLMTVQPNLPSSEINDQPSFDSNTSSCTLRNSRYDSDMAQALPLTKLASLLVKTLAKPLSKRIKHEFSRYKFTKQILIDVGQTSHNITSRMQIWSAGYRVKSIKPLTEDKALKDGAEFVGESFIFLVSGSLVVWEYNRSAESARSKEEKKRQDAKAERAALQAKLVALDARLRAVEDNVQHNSQSILGVGGAKYVAPSQDMLVPIEEEDEEGAIVHRFEASHKDGRVDSSSRSESSPNTSTPANSKAWWKLW